jgi:hypothetical protein
MTDEVTGPIYETTRRKRATRGRGTYLLRVIRL